jgi:hypothetical protein
MAVKPEIHADLRITQGDDVIRVRGRGDTIEVHNWSVGFFWRYFKKSAPLTLRKYKSLDEKTRRSGLNVMLKTNYLRVVVLGDKTRTWIKFLIKMVLPRQ